MASYRHPIEKIENNLKFESSHLVENFHGEKKLSFSLFDLIVEVQAAVAVASSFIQTLHVFLLVRSL